MKKKSIALLLAGALTASGALAGHIGPVQGRSWPIAELSAVSLIEKTLEVMQKDGSWDKLVATWRKQTIDGIVNPPPVPGIDLAVEDNVRFFDPAYTFQQDIRDGNGRVVVKKGTHINPLDYRPLSKPVVFLDGREKKQRELAAEMLDEDPSTIVILTAGSWIDMQNKLRYRIYYDQQGMLSKYFGIRKTPSIITQDGKKLKIEERANL